MPSMYRDGIYRMPAEWEPQKSTWIAWPHNKKDWPGKFRNIPNVFAVITSALSKVQLVNILVNNKSDYGHVVATLKKFGTKFNNIRLINCKTDRSWTRDSLPIFLKVKNDKKIMSKWQFNAWAKYKNYKNYIFDFLTITILRLHLIAPHGLWTFFENLVEDTCEFF